MMPIIMSIMMAIFIIMHSVGEYKSYNNYNINLRMAIVKTNKHSHINTNAITIFIM